LPSDNVTAKFDCIEPRVISYELSSTTLKRKLIMFENLSSKQLTRAASIKERIESLEAELAEVIGGSSQAGSSVATGATSGKGKGPISAAGLARIKAAQKARWAKFHKDKGTSAPTASKLSGKPKRTMSAAAKAKIRAVAKARWAKAKAAGRSAL
jgi:hypothetical protein